MTLAVRRAYGARLRVKQQLKSVSYATLHAASGGAGSPLNASQGTTNTTRRLRKERKRVSELPKTYTLPDGTIAKPLPKWGSGLGEEDAAKADFATLQHQASKGNADLIKPLLFGEYLLSAPGETALGTGTKPKRGRPRKQAEFTTPALVLEAGGQSVMRRRRRKADVSTDAAEKVALDSVDPDVHSLSEPLVEEVAPPLEEQTTLAKEILDNLARFPNCLLLTRVGQFYESYFSQAAEIASLLNIKLTTRKWGGKRVAMCGFPLAHLDKYLRVLVGENRRLVAMCEEFPVNSTTDTSNGALREGKISRGLPTRTFERRVTRVITPGTLIDEPFLNQYENNYLLAISAEGAQAATTDNIEPSQLGLAWIDVSTGEFFSKVSSMDTLRDELARIGPKEVVLDKSMKRRLTDDDDGKEERHPILAALAEEQHFVSYQALQGDEQATTTTTSTQDEKATRLTEPDDLLPETVLPESNSAFSPPEASAISLLTAYLRAHLREHMPVLGVPVREGDALESSIERTQAGRVSLAPPPRMHLDAHTLRALEIREGMREGGTKGSLLSVVRRTKTTGGTRLLARWLAAPSLSLAEITSRHSLVAFLLARPHLRADLTALLVSIPDVGRLSQKLMLGKGDASDVRAVGRAIRAWNRLKNTITMERAFEGYERQSKDPKAPSVNDEEWQSMDTLLSRMDGLDSLEARIASALEGAEADDAVEMGQEVEGSGVEGAASELQDGPLGVDEDPARRLNWRPHAPQRWAVKPEFSPALTQLHDTLRDLLKRREKMEAELLMRYSAPSLTLRSSPALGMHVHIARRKRDCRLLDANPEFVKVSESGSTKGYFWRPWTQLGSEIVETTLALQVAEREAFDILRREINAHAPALRRNARVLDELDVTLGFAALAAEHGYVRPVMSDDTTYHVTDGRHPTVEMGLLSAGRTFTPNTVCLSGTDERHNGQGNLDEQQAISHTPTCCPTPTARLHILTGPNMAGKSTVLRQTALIAILAQAGSFVPATAAHLGLVDAVFARVGARDDLARDRSTFMVEMLETGAVLRRATSRSLVIMDEIGRGTAFRDGLAIAFATVVHLLRVNRCRALFATHFMEVVDLVGWEAERRTDARAMDADSDCDNEADDRDVNPFKDVAFFCTDVYDADSSHIAYAYRLRRGVNRRSHALRVAALAGVPQAALSVAQDTLGWLDSQNDRVLPPDQLRELGRRIVQQVEIAGP